MTEAFPRNVSYNPDKALAPDALLKMDLDESLERPAPDVATFSKVNRPSVTEDGL